MVMLSEGKLFINGKLRTAERGAKHEIIGPWTGEVVGYAADASAADMDEAITAARRAFDESDWSSNRTLRRELVAKLGEGLKANRDRIAAIVRHEGGGAPAAMAGPLVDLPMTAFEPLLKMFDSFEWEKDMGRAVSMGADSDRLIVREPAGVVGAITPWNMPLFIGVGKVAPALLAGCTVILKGAPETPLINAVLGEIAHQVGFPAGVFNVVTSHEKAALGEMLVTDKRVDLISFTGSTAVGRRIMEKGAPTLKRLFLELGGKSANIVLEDTPDFAMAVAYSIVCFHAGQGCAIPTRLLVPRSRYQEAIEVLKSTYEVYSNMWGDPDEPANVMGPLISARQRDRVLGYIESGKAEGAQLLAGGKAVTNKGSGFFIEPTCFIDVTNDMRIAREEIFGPVLVVIPFEDDDDAVRIANDNEYGLSGAVRAGSRERAMRVARRIRAGTVSVNGGMWLAPDMPFGGYKQSGVGREWGMQGFEEYLETKALGIGVGQ
jgi:aldehyde dehydrogenase (NAD+)